MLISHSHRFIFIHIHKVAGSSIRKVLWPYQPLHVRARLRIFFALRGAYLMVFPPKAPRPESEASASEVYAGGFVKAVKHAIWYKGIPPHSTALLVRELAPRQFESYYKFAFVRNPWDWQVSNYHYVLNTPWHFMHNAARSLGSFEAYLNYLGRRKVIRRQKDYLTDRDGKVIVDFIGRFENLAEDFRSICSTIGIPYSLAHENRSPDRTADYRKYYNDRTARLVEEHFRDDIEMFGYKF